MILKFLHCIITEVIGGEGFRSEGFTCEVLADEVMRCDHLGVEGFTCEVIAGEVITQCFT